MEKLIRPKTLAENLGISLSTLYDRMKEPDFPRKVQISKQAVGFRESEVIEWMDRNTEEKRESNLTPVQ
ncbi:helix-turn-helix transcriptional regulator [Fodinibius halophilus]|uniref:AlpA family phage regulatory protein n=1 Tax=Fodinibius halophilus TaxID=1736908 RepID=A0A6M1T969_9BACT|nr:AlpA family phage regulatory protein [Fodinibius halophilus]NGP90015.1 AlpA family phage regulatory protein [Fodinibius halophilus]